MEKRDEPKGGEGMKLSTIPKPDSLTEFEGLPIEVKEALMRLDGVEFDYRKALKKARIEIPDEDTI